MQEKSRLFNEKNTKDDVYLYYQCAKNKQQKQLQTRDSLLKYIILKKKSYSKRDLKLTICVKEWKREQLHICVYY